MTYIMSHISYSTPGWLAENIYWWKDFPQSNRNFLLPSFWFSPKDSLWETNNLWELQERRTRGLLRERGIWKFCLLTLMKSSKGSNLWFRWADVYFKIAVSYPWWVLCYKQNKVVVVPLYILISQVPKNRLRIKLVSFGYLYVNKLQYNIANLWLDYCFMCCVKRFDTLQNINTNPDCSF